MRGSWELVLSTLALCPGIGVAPHEEVVALRRAVIDEEGRVQALIKVERLGPAAAPLVPQVLCVLQQETPIAFSYDKDTHIFEATMALLAIGPPAVPELIEALGRPCGLAIGQDASGQTCPVSSDILADPEYCGWTRGLVGEPLRMMGPEILPALREALVRPGRQRLYVAVVLGNLGKDGASAAKELEWALTDGDPETRAAAARALGLIGPAARSAITILRVSLTDSDARVREAASRALKVLESPPQ